jgi:hypothetical protein
MAIVVGVVCGNVMRVEMRGEAGKRADLPLHVLLSIVSSSEPPIAQTRTNAVAKAMNPPARRRQTTKSCSRLRCHLHPETQSSGRFKKGPARVVIVHQWRLLILGSPGVPCPFVYQHQHPISRSGIPACTRSAVGCHRVR